MRGLAGAQTSASRYSLKRRGTFLIGGLAGAQTSASRYSPIVSVTVTTLLFKMPKSKSRGSRTAAGPKRPRRGAATPRTTSTTGTTLSTTCTTTATMTEAVLPPDNLLPPTPQSTVASMTLEQLMNAVGTRVRLEMQAQSSSPRRHGRHRTYNGVIQHPLQVSSWSVWESIGMAQ